MCSVLWVQVVFWARTVACNLCVLSATGVPECAACALVASVCRAAQL